MENLEAEYFDRIETVLGQMEGLKNVVGLLLDEMLEARVESLNTEELITRYTDNQIILNILFDLMFYQTQETREFVNSHISTKKGGRLWEDVQMAKAVFTLLFKK